MPKKSKAKKPSPAAKTAPKKKELTEDELDQVSGGLLPALSGPVTTTTTAALNPIDAPVVGGASIPGGISTVL